MTLFELFNGEKISLPPNKKIIFSSEFSTLMQAHEIVQKAKKDEITYREEAIAEGKEVGLQEGLSKFTEQIAHLEEERKKIRQEMENSLVPLAMTAVKKILGRELELNPDAIVDIIATALKGVSQHKKIKIFVNKNDLEYLENERQRLKEIFDHLETLNISAREDVPEKGCIVETEVGILHVGLENQVNALEKAFQIFLQKG